MKSGVIFAGVRMSTRDNAGSLSAVLTKQVKDYKLGPDGVAVLSKDSIILLNCSSCSGVA